jgi:hypothetical protein
MARCKLCSIIEHRENTIKLEKKIVQFVTLFHLLKLKRPLTDFESMHGLLFLKMESNLDKHWINISGWGMAKCMTNVVLASTKIAIQTTNYIFISCDEDTSIYNQSWIFVLGYVVEN